MRWQSGCRNPTKGEDDETLSFRTVMRSAWYHLSITMEPIDVSRAELRALRKMDSLRLAEVFALDDSMGLC